MTAFASRAADVKLWCGWAAPSFTSVSLPGTAARSTPRPTLPVVASTGPSKRGPEAQRENGWEENGLERDRKQLKIYRKYTGYKARRRRKRS
jgi:hypothetical protein